MIRGLLMLLAGFATGLAIFFAFGPWVLLAFVAGNVVGVALVVAEEWGKL